MHKVDLPRGRSRPVSETSTCRCTEASQTHTSMAPSQTVYLKVSYTTTVSRVCDNSTFVRPKAQAGQSPIALTVYPVIVTTTATLQLCEAFVAKSKINNNNLDEPSIAVIIQTMHKKSTISPHKPSSEKEAEWRF